MEQTPQEMMKEFLEGLLGKLATAIDAASDNQRTLIALMAEHPHHTQQLNRMAREKLLLAEVCGEECDPSTVSALWDELNVRIAVKRIMPERGTAATVEHYLKAKKARGAE